VEFFGGCGWVEHTDRFMVSARCWVLRRHLLVGCFFWLLLAWTV
jgi:hypothetical protein